MKGRRTAAMLCVLLVHALAIFFLVDVTRPRDRGGPDLPEQLMFVSQVPDPGPILDDDLLPPREPDSRTRLDTPRIPDGAVTGEDLPAGASGAITGFIDWPQEGRDAAARVLAREAEAERIAKMFAGPQGTWASLTKRQQSELNHFRWKPGVDGLERDENGTTIYRMPNGCVLVSFVFIGCPIGKKPPAYGDLFKDMRKYFDEQRLPQTDEGNGREPESMRPPKWSKPLK